MNAQKHVHQMLDPTDTFEENPGVKQKFIVQYPPIDPTTQDIATAPHSDPVKLYNYEGKHVPKEEIIVPMAKLDTLIEPSVSIRLGLVPEPGGTIGAKYQMKETRSMKALKHKNRLERFYNKVAFCDYEVVRLPSPVHMDTISRIEEESPTVSKAKVMPAKPSRMTSSDLIRQKKSSLEKRLIKSGVFINITEDEDSDVTEMQTKHKRRYIYKRKHQEPTESTANDMEKNKNEMDFFVEGEQAPGMYNKSTHVSDNLVLGKVQDIISPASSATSMHDAMPDEFHDLSWCEIPLTSHLVQTLRGAQCEKPKRKYRKGCLENHSFTKLKQRVLADFPHYTVCGSIHQGDYCFSAISRNNQGLCMPIAAFCYGQLNKPNTWTCKSIDAIVELGNCHFLSSIAELHLQHGRKELTSSEIHNFVQIGQKKIKFEVSHPEVKGLVRSTDIRIFNITSGLPVFFSKYKAGVLRTNDLNLLLWKLSKKCFLVFDAGARKSNLFQAKNGTATMAMVRLVKAIAAIILDRSDVGNSPFCICPIRALRIMHKDEQEEEEEHRKELNTFKAINDRQAVVQGSFDLGDLCFLFNRNKQSLSMSIMALAYSRISAPHSWQRKTLDKILIIGNQLHSLIADAEHCPDVAVEHLPALFTVGPYIIEMHIYPNRFADIMYKKQCCLFTECLAKFLETHNNCIAQIGKSFIAIWRQRDLFFSFDPFTRNREGLACRKGGACVTMNKDLDSLTEIVLKNFDNRDAVFHLHAVKLIRIHRDAEMSKHFPKQLTLHEVPLETFHKHKCMKSGKRALEKPIATADFHEHAMKKLLQVDDAEDVQSNVVSIDSTALPCNECPKLIRMPKPKNRQAHEEPYIVDLDSPSLSDTQMVPKRPGPSDEEINIDDLAAFGLTQEEKELEEEPEAVAHVYGEGDVESGIDEEEEESKYGGVMSQVTSGDLDPCYRIDNVNTDLTYCYRLLPALELPMKAKHDRDVVIQQQQQNHEMETKREFVSLSEDAQILCGTLSIFDVLDSKADPNVLVPYVCIMAAAYDQEKPIYRWTKSSLGFIIRAGRMLLDQYDESFVHIDDFRFAFEKIELLATVDIIFNTYIGDGLFDSFSGRKVLEEFIYKHVFSRQDSGFVIVPHYACSVFFKRNLFYFFDAYNCDEKGNVRLDGVAGKACVMRFRDMNTLIKRLVRNLSLRVQTHDTSGMNFRMLILAKAKFKRIEDDEGQKHVESLLEFEKMRTASEELKRPSNYLKLPDGSQLIRGSKHVRDMGSEVEMIAPYIAVMAAVVGYKYSVRTWSADILDYVVQAGYELYRNAKYAFVQLGQLDLPHMTIGKDRLQAQVRFALDVPWNYNLKTPLLEVIRGEREWMLIVTKVFTCAVCQRNGVFYLYTPFACNELGLNHAAGYAAMARFRSLEDLCLRILHNKGKRDMAEKGVYTRYALYICRVKKQPLADRPKKYPGDDFTEDLAEDREDANEEENEEADESPVKHGYYKVTEVEVIEGTKALPRPASDKTDLGEDHFAGLAAALMVIHKPLDTWTKKNVDKALDIGEDIFKHADTLEQARKRTIRNILIGRYFFDVIVRAIDIGSYKHMRTFSTALKYVLRKRRFVILQTGQGTFVIYMDGESVHLFHPYEVSFTEDVSNACWVKFRNVRQMCRFLKEANNLHRFKFYTFSVINVTKAPRAMVVDTVIQEWIRSKAAKPELPMRTFNEHESWMDLNANPWSRLGDALMAPTSEPIAKWFAWDVEYPNDLYLLSGTKNLHDRSFCTPHRGKQMLPTLVVFIGMTCIYEVKEWNPSVIDAVMINGYKYHIKCVDQVTEQNHEIEMGDLVSECEIFPFTFRVRHRAVVEGTMFLENPKRFNLYRALRYFFDEYFYRAGVAVCERNGVKKMVAFAKRKDNEYYMFDCATFGKPMFAPQQSFPYVLYCTTLARLIHVLVLTLRGGNFCIYEVVADSFTAVEGDVNPYVDERPVLNS